MGKSTKDNKRPLLLKIMTRLFELDFKEEYIPREGGIDIYGIHWSDGTVVVNPIPHCVDTIIHEIIHELHPDYSERAVRSLTGKIMKSLSDEEIKTIYGEYRRRIEGE